MKMDGRLGLNPLKGEPGDALHAVLCGSGHNLRLLIKKLRLFCAGVRTALMARSSRFNAHNYAKSLQPFENRIVQDGLLRILHKYLGSLTANTNFYQR